MLFFIKIVTFCLNWVRIVANRNKMKINTIYLLILLLSATMVSCVDTYDIPDPLEANKIVVECELSPPYHIKAFVATTGNLNGRQQPKFPFDADIRLYSEIDEEFVFKYNEESELYEVTNGRLRPGFSYVIQANMGDEDNMIPISGKTTIPRGAKVASAQITDVVSDNGINTLTVDIELPNNGQPYYYMHLNVSTATMENGERVSTGNTINGDYAKLISDRNAISNIIQMPGLLIDAERLLDNKFQIQLDLSDELLSKSEILDKLNIDLKTVSESYYFYQSSVSKELSLQSQTESSVDASVIEPNITYTNIDDGYGYFGAFTTTRESITIE